MSYEVKPVTQQQATKIEETRQQLLAFENIIKEDKKEEKSKQKLQGKSELVLLKYSPL